MSQSVRGKAASATKYVIQACGSQVGVCAVIGQERHASYRSGGRMAGEA